MCVCMCVYVCMRMYVWVCVFLSCCVYVCVFVRMRVYAVGGVGSRQEQGGRKPGVERRVAEG